MGVSVFVALFGVTPPHQVPVVMTPRHTTTTATSDLLLAVRPHTNVPLPPNAKIRTVSGTTSPRAPILSPNPRRHLRTLAIALPNRKLLSKGQQRPRPLVLQHPPCLSLHRKQPPSLLFLWQRPHGGRSQRFFRLLLYKTPPNPAMMR